MYPEFFENASFFIRIKKYLHPHEEHFQKYPNPPENTVVFKMPNQTTKYPCINPEDLSACSNGL